MADPAVLRLGWMLVALGLVLLPAVTRLPPWVSAVFACAAAWRFAALRRGWRLPPLTLRLGLALVVCLGVLWTYRTLNGLEAGSALLVAMAAMKLLETRSKRDLQVLAFIGFFLTLAQLLYDQPVWSLVWLVVVVTAITLALLQGVRAGPPLPWRAGTGVVLRMLGFALPVALVLFLLFPRVPGPFWALPSRSVAGLSGLDEEMTPGSIASLTLSETVAFRAKFRGPPPPPAQRYWRGPVLETFTGFTWRDSNRSPMPSRPIATRGVGYAYRSMLEPNGRPWLLALDLPVRWSDNTAYLTHDFQLVSRHLMDSVRKLEIESWPAVTLEHGPRPAFQAAMLRLPSSRNPDTIALARELRAAAASDGAFVDAVLAMFREQPFTYTLRPPLLSGGHQVDDFLFRTRRGFCEHFASAFTVLARAGEVPARVVTGYQGGELNPVSGWVVVRQSDAHAWSEVWLEGRGWTRVDPTAAVAPNRIELGLEGALPADEALPGRALRRVAALERLRQSWDAVNSLWNDWVLGYGPERQHAFMDWLGFPSRDWGNMVLALTALVAGAMGALTSWLAWQSRGPRPEPALRLYRAYCDRLARAGVVRRPSEGPADYAARVAQARPDLAATVQDFTQRYLGLRYGRASPAVELPALRRALKSLRP